MTQQTNWLPGIIVLAVTFVAAAAFLFFNRRKVTPSPEARDGVLDDLEHRAQLLITQLKELEAEKHNLSPETYTAERSRLELEAAAALRAKDEYVQRKEQRASASPAAPAPAPTGFSAKHPRLAGALWGAGIVLFFGTLSYVLVSEQRERDEGGSPTGRMPPGQQASAAPREDPEFLRARERLANNPGDLDAASLVAHTLIQRKELDEAQRITDRSLAVDPFHIESRVHRAVLRAARGDMAGAEVELTELVNVWPEAQEGLLVLGSIAMHKNDQAKALESFERFAAETPRNIHPPQLIQAIRELRAELGVK